MAGKRAQAKTKGRKKHMGTMDFILLIVFLCLTVFTIAMIALFTVYGSVPDTLITCVFATLRHPWLDKDHQGEEAGKEVAACGHETGKGGGGTDCTADRGTVRRDRSCWQERTTRRKSGII